MLDTRQQANNSNKLIRKSTRILPPIHELQYCIWTCVCGGGGGKFKDNNKAKRTWGLLSLPHTPPPKLLSEGLDARPTPLHPPYLKVWISRSWHFWGSFGQDFRTAKYIYFMMQTCFGSTLYNYLLFVRNSTHGLPCKITVIRQTAGMMLPVSSTSPI